MSAWLRTLVVAALFATVPTTVSFMAQGGCGGGGCGDDDEDEEQHDGECGGGGHGGSGGSGGHKGFGSNLSVPVVFAEGFGLKGLPTSVDTWLRPRPADVNSHLPEYFNASDVLVQNGTSYYPQRTSSHWQAGWRDGVAGVAEPAVVNWGDNLTRRSWTTGSMIRIETALYQDAADTMTAYSLERLAGRGAHAIWGATGQVYQTSYRDVFTVTGRFTIQKLVGRAGPVDTGVPSATRAVYDSFTDVRPRGGCNAQVNGAGSVTYSYQWPLRQWPIPEAQKIGWWRITFSLDPAAQYTVTPQRGQAAQTFVVPRNVNLQSVDASDTSGNALFRPILQSSTASVLEIEVMARAGVPQPSGTSRLSIVEPSGGTIYGPAIACGDAGDVCSVDLPAGATIGLSAVPSPGSSFLGWSADCAAGVVTMTSNRTCVPTFSAIPTPPTSPGLVRLTIVRPTGGTVYAAGIACGDAGSTCVVDMPAGGVTLGISTVPSPGYTFTGWSGAGCGPQVTLNSSLTCTPRFSPP